MDDNVNWTFNTIINNMSSFAHSLKTSVVELHRKYWGIAIGISTTHSLQAYTQSTSGLATAIMDLSLPISSDSIGSMDYLSSELSDLGNIVVAIGISTIHSLHAYLQCSSG